MHGGGLTMAIGTTIALFHWAEAGTTPLDSDELIMSVNGSLISKEKFFQ